MDRSVFCLARSRNELRPVLLAWAAGIAPRSQAPLGNARRRSSASSKSPCRQTSRTPSLRARPNSTPQRIARQRASRESPSASRSTTKRSFDSGRSQAELGNESNRISRPVGCLTILRFRKALSAALLAWAAGIAALCSTVLAGDDAVHDKSAAAARGYERLTTTTYLPPDFDQDVFDNLWRVWPEPLRDEARRATPAERRRMAFERYGLVERPGSEGKGPALGYVDDGRGGWVMNCLACHTGQVADQVIFGSPNAEYALETLTEEVRALKLRMARPLSHMDLGSLKMPLGTTRGTTNSVMFGVALGSLRDADLNFRSDLKAPELVHHDADAPAFWNVRRKKSIYTDGFVAKSHRPLLQFVMLPRNSGETLRGWEQDFADILAWIESLEAPRYRWEIDRGLAEAGREVFERVCADCHGTYGEDATYPNRIIQLEIVGTDPVRVQSLTVDYRRKMQDGWFGEYGKLQYVLDPGGYVAPPLDGVWASAPYFHNGSVPTLWHVLHPDERPAVWSRTPGGYDRERVGLEVTAWEDVPASVRTAAERREYFETRKTGKSAAGHRFPDELSEDERRAVLEYLKTL